MDNPVYGRRWIAFSQQFLQRDLDMDSSSICSSSPPPSPLSPSPSCTSHEDDCGSFDFSTMSLCREVPALFGLNPAQPRPPLCKINDGFYKRLIHWLNNKKRSRRHIPDAHKLSEKISPPSREERNVIDYVIATKETEQDIFNEWTIPWNDVQFGSTISQGKSCTISRGRWHGDVVIHKFRLNSAREVNSFWSEVHSLSKLRHDNLLLFMGVTVNYPDHSVINSAPRGVTLTKLREEYGNGHADRISLRAAVTIGHQVAQAMGYLHARGLFHGKLNTDNIFLDGENYKVKLSLLDHGLVPVSHRGPNGSVCLPKSLLGYLSPEHVRSLVLRPPQFQMTAGRTKFMDIYAFGSLLFDLLTGRPPYWTEPVHSALWRLGKGETPNLDKTGCSAIFKAVISSCWSYEPWKRPDFVEIVDRLQSSTLLCKSHSSSEPERLNRLGICKLAC